MLIFIITIHIIVSLFLIGVILLQSGRGGGLAESFGSDQVERIFGTKSTSILARITSICAMMFIFTCLTLAILSTHRSRSLIDRVPQIPPQAETQKISEQDETQSQTQRDSETSGVEKISEEQQVQQTGDLQKEQQQKAEGVPEAQ